MTDTVLSLWHGPLNRWSSGNRRPVSSVRVREIIAEVAEVYGLKPNQLTGKNRTKLIVHARQAAQWTIRDELGISLPAIGRFFDQDHTTVLHGIRAHERRMAEAVIQEAVDGLVCRLESDAA